MVYLDDLFDTSDKASQQLLLSALDQLAEGVIVADAEGRLIYVNSAAAAIHGVKKLHVSPENYSETYHLLTVDEEPYPFEQLPLSRTVREGVTVEDAHWKIRRPDGRIIDAIGTSRPVFDGERQVASVLTLSDKTEELAAQRDLARALATKDALLFEVNHRVKNNLALVTSLLSLHGKRCEDEASRQSFKDITSRVAVLVDIHRRLYAMGQHSDIEIVDFLTQMTIETINSLAAKSVEVSTLQEGSVSLPVEKATTLALALNELVLNSLKHAFDDVEKPSVELAITADESELVVEYSDNGPGITDEQASGGSGIGKALVSQLTTALSATLEQVNSRPGYCVRITVPLDREAR